MNRHARRSEVRRFEREVSGGLLSYLVDRADPRVGGEPLLRDAVRFWNRNVAARKPVCFGCQEMFTDHRTAGAFLMVTAARSATSASISALCTACWRDLPMP